METVSLVIDKAIDKIILDTGNYKKIESIKKRHVKKVHFIPQRYRVFNGLLQSMNIKFGAFIEQLFQELVLNSDNYVLHPLSGNASKRYSISKENDNIIDTYITDRQTSYYEPEDDISKSFEQLINKVKENSLKEASEFYEVRHDIDLFFKKKDSNEYFYGEIKYNDDHDSGKFVDISRKFIKTYAYLYEILLKEYGRDPDKFSLKPCMFFFNNKKMMGNIYIPEKTNIYRGERIFKDFFTYIKYSEIDNYLKNISENEETIKKFDDLYNKVMRHG